MTRAEAMAWAGRMILGEPPAPTSAPDGQEGTPVAGALPVGERTGDTAEQCDRCGGDVARCGHEQIITWRRR